jgi:hypothetical protein
MLHRRSGLQGMHDEAGDWCPPSWTTAGLVARATDLRAIRLSDRQPSKTGGVARRALQANG